MVAPRILIFGPPMPETRPSVLQYIEKRPLRVSFSFIKLANKLNRLGNIMFRI